MVPRAWIAIVIAAVAVAALLITRANHAALRELRLGAEAERAQDVDGAIVCYRRAASWWFPWSSAADRGVQHLQRLALDARQAQDAPAELLATRAWFAALASRRWLIRDSALAGVAARLAELSVQTAPVMFGQGRSPAQRRATLQAQLSAQDAPTPLGMLLSVIGLSCWVAAAFLLSRRGFDADLQPTAAARTLGTWIVLGFGVFVLGLALA